MSRPAPLVLVTRPEPAGSRLVAELEARGYRALSSPMLQVERVGRLDPQTLAGCDGVIFTSAVAARLAGEDLAGGAPEIPAWCVGDATAAAAREAGFADARSAGRDADALLELLGESKPRRPLVIRGADVAVDVAAALREKGADPQELMIYRAAMADALSPAAAQALADGAAAALFYSARTAQAFRTAAAGLDLSGVNALAISPRTAAALTPAGFARVLTSSDPTEEALLGLLIATMPRQH